MTERVSCRFFPGRMDAPDADTVLMLIQMDAADADTVLIRMQQLVACRMDAADADTVQILCRYCADADTAVTIQMDAPDTVLILKQ